MYLHNERNHASLWALGRERFPSAPGEASNLLLPRLDPGVQKASSRTGSAYGVIFRTSATPFGSARNLASNQALA